jgi:hypothetical protein
MIRAQCDNCGAVREEPAKLLRKNDSYRFNGDEANRWLAELVADLWQAMTTPDGPALFCPGCLRAARLAVEAARK